VRWRRTLTSPVDLFNPCQRTGGGTRLAAGQNLLCVRFAARLWRFVCCAKHATDTRCSPSHPQHDGTPYSQRLVVLSCCRHLVAVASGSQTALARRRWLASVSNAPPPSCSLNIYSMVRAPGTVPVASGYHGWRHASGRLLALFRAIAKIMEGLSLPPLRHAAFTSPLSAALILLHSSFSHYYQHALRFRTALTGCSRRAAFMLFSRSSAGAV